jgi:beta-phosphoglucomutase-like phosphatase (HAD superfamily)
MQRYFQMVITGDEVVKGKPDPAIFLRAARSLRVGANETLVFEDSVSGVQAAKAAGMKCLGIAPPFRHHALLGAGADRVLANFHEASVGQLREFFG